MKINKIYSLVLASIFVALFVLFGMFLTIPDFFNVKLTFKNLPLYISCILLGKYYGMLIGFTGEFMLQCLLYGVDPTTIIYCTPYLIVGYIFGFLRKKIFDRDLNFKKIDLYINIFIIQFLLTLLNTLAIFLSSKIMGYYSFVYVFGSFSLRIIQSIIMSILYCIIIPKLLKIIKNKILK